MTQAASAVDVGTRNGRVAAVTGATGFLGTHLCRRLLADGWTVRGLSRPGSDRGDLEREGAGGETGDLEWFVGDLFDGATLRSLVDGADAVFHLAGVGLWSAGPETVRRVNLDGTRSLLRACHERDVGRIVFTSTAGTRRPPEPGAAADETDVAEPIGAYQESKAEAEVLVDQYAATTGDAVTVHPTSIFGPGDEKFTGPLLGMATDPKFFAHLPGGVSVVGVSDVVDGVLAAYERGGSGEHYLLGGENLTFRNAVRRIANCADGSPARVRVPPQAIRAAGPVAGTVGDVTGKHVFPFDSQMAELATQKMFYSSRKASEELGYSYDPLEEHVPAALSWYRSQ